MAPSESGTSLWLAYLGGSVPQRAGNRRPDRVGEHCVILLFLLSVKLERYARKQKKCRMLLLLLVVFAPWNVRQGQSPKDPRCNSADYRRHGLDRAWTQ